MNNATFNFNSIQEDLLGLTFQVGVCTACKQSVDQVNISLSSSPGKGEGIPAPAS
jgi:hypothetical protein